MELAEARAGGEDEGPDACASPLLAVEGVTMRFGGVIALEDVSFEVARGAICGLIGPNGAGKTTLFNCISRLYDPGAGRSSSTAGRWPPRRARDRRARHRPHVPEPRAVPHHDRARERDGRRACARRGGFLANALATADGAARGGADRRARRRADRGIRARRASPTVRRARFRSAPSKRVELARALAKRAEAPAARRAGRRPQSRGGRSARARRSTRSATAAASPCCWSSIT